MRSDRLELSGHVISQPGKGPISNLTCAKHIGSTAGPLQPAFPARLHNLWIKLRLSADPRLTHLRLIASQFSGCPHCSSQVALRDAAPSFLGSSTMAPIILHPVTGAIMESEGIEPRVFLWHSQVAKAVSVFSAAIVAILLLTQSFRALAVLAGSGVEAFSARKLADYVLRKWQNRARSSESSSTFPAAQTGPGPQVTQGTV